VWVQHLASLPAVGGILIVASLTVIAAFRWVRLFPLAFLLLGLAWATCYARSLTAQTVPHRIEGKSITVTGRVLDLPRSDRRGVRFLFGIDKAIYKGMPVPVPQRVRLNFYRPKHASTWLPEVDSRWQLQVRLKNPHGFRNPGGFDYETYLFSQKIRATGYIVASARRVELGQSHRSGFNLLREKIRNQIRKQVHNPRQVGILSALAIGDKQDISTNQWHTLRNTGTSHIVAISGLHLTLVSGMVFLLARYLWSIFAFGARRLPAQKFAILPALISAYLYSGLAGFSVPTQRALVMLIVLYTSLLFARQSFRLQTLALAMLAVLIYDPLSVLSPSFWLSFSAVAIILFIAVTRPLEKNWFSGLRVQFGLSIGLIPLSLMFFQSASLVSPLANLVAIPVYSLVVVPFTLLGICLPDVLAGGLLNLAALVSQYFWYVLHWLGELPFAAVHFTSPIPALVILAMAGMVIYVASAGTPLRYIGAVLLLPLTWVPQPPSIGKFRASILDVGQGLSVVVQTHSHTLVFDVGARFSSRLNAGDAVVVPFLRQQGISAIDTLIISHDDNDHMGGFPSVRNAIKVRRLVSNVPLSRNAEACVQGDSWQWDEVAFEVLHPGPGAGGDRNNDSCVLMVHSGPTRLLIPGDIEKPAELELVKDYGERLQANYLVAPHHGSRTSSSREFLAAVRPQWILVPAGHLNRYHHPSARVTRRYAGSGIAWLVTGEVGAIEIDTASTDTRPSGFRIMHARYWQN